ncbi:hypothetical protein AAJCM20276_37790 (plasmid) [Acetobacter aceti]|uniref:Uncharacterized protein n=1 Tax=Acetobacter aceti TaxID=435 RepID=A0A6S6PRD9_ACEAC|nr:hypothetical protein AAJCM20276_37790 [Acetobacter aceti]
MAQDDGAIHQIETWHDSIRRIPVLISRAEWYVELIAHLPEAILHARDRDREASLRESRGDVIRDTFGFDGR